MQQVHGSVAVTRAAIETGGVLFPALLVPLQQAILQREWQFRDQGSTRPPRGRLSPRQLLHGADTHGDKELRHLHGTL